MNLDTEFPLKFYINLSRRQDRRFRMEGLLEELGWSAERTIAADERHVRRAHAYGAAGKYACALSHRMALRKARLAKADAVLILEDDVEFAPDALERLKEIELPEDWGLFYFGCQHTERPERMAANLVRVRGAYDTHAYAVRARWLPEVLKVLNGRNAGLSGHGGNTGVGQDFLMARLQRTIPAYAAWPNLAWPTVITSGKTQAAHPCYDENGRQKRNRHVIESLDNEWAVQCSGQGYAVQRDGRIDAAPDGAPLRLHLGEPAKCAHGFATVDFSRWDRNRPLPFAEHCAEVVSVDGCIEAMDAGEAWRFFRELFRLLRPGGVLRLTFRDLAAVLRQESAGWSAGAPFAASARAISETAREEGGSIAPKRWSPWTLESLRTLLGSIGYAVAVSSGASPSPARDAELPSTDEGYVEASKR